MRAVENVAVEANGREGPDNVTDLLAVFPLVYVPEE